jgi:hypothetical protein
VVLDWVLALALDLPDHKDVLAADPVVHPGATVRFQDLDSLFASHIYICEDGRAD